jgi:hypothetical protein
VVFDLAQRFALLASMSGGRLVGVHRSFNSRWCSRRRGWRHCFWRQKPIRAALSLILIVAIAPALPSFGAPEDHVEEYGAKATFLAAFPKFVEWPSDAFPSEQAPLLLCVFGDFSFGTSLAEKTRGTLIHGRRVEVRWARKERDLRTCQILFVSRSEAKRYERIFKAVEGASVLTVGETPDFLASGGAIDFLVAEDRLQFEVNVGAATDAHLRISANMLALARHVITRTESTKSSLGFSARSLAAFQAQNLNMEVKQ